MTRKLFINQHGARNYSMKSISTHSRFLNLTFLLLIALAFASPARAQHEDMTRNFECVAKYGAGENDSNFATKDHYVFLDHGDKLRVLDIADPAKPREIACIDSAIGGMVGIRGLALYFQGYDKFSIVDISDPYHPRIRASIDAGVEDFSAHLMGKYLMADEARKNGTGYVIFDLEDPFNPKKLTRGGLNTVSAKYNVFFFTDGKDYLQVSLVLSRNGSGFCKLQDLTSSPTTIAAFPYYDAMEISFKTSGGKVSVEYPGHSIPIPKLIKDGTIWQLDSESWWHQKTFANGWVMNEDQSGIQLARSDKPEEILFQGYGGMVALPGALYLIGGKMLDLSGSKLVDKGELPGMARGIDVVGSLAIANGERSLSFYDISDPVKPILRGEYRFPTHKGVRQARISGNRAYLMDDDDGLVILDVSNPKSPRFLARHQQAKDAEILTLQGDRLFLSDEKAGFHVLDCANIKSPKVLGECREGTGTLCISGSNLYMAKGELKILDISDLKSIHAVGSFKAQNPITDIATSGTTVFALSNGVIDAVDASNPAKPVRIGSIDIYPNYGDYPPLKKLHNALYLVTLDGSYSSYDVIDISNPRNLKYSDHSSDNNALAEQASSNLPTKTGTKYPGWYLCLPFFYHNTCDNNTGLEIYDCSEPLHPRHAGTYDGTSTDTRILLYKDTIYLPDDGGGLLIIQHTK